MQKNNKKVKRSEVLDDIWDDRLLMKAYEQAIQLKSSDVAKSIASDTNKNASTSQLNVDVEDESSNESSTFKLGDYVRATYDLDTIDYEAQIISIDDENGVCMVKFIGYDNEQTVRLADLVDSWGAAEQKKQELEAAAAVAATTTSEESNADTEEFCPKELYRNDSNTSSLPAPPMPPLPPMLKDSLGADSEHFSAMLMSWYMSGYYTGLYQGHKLAQQKTKKLPN